MIWESGLHSFSCSFVTTLLLRVFLKIRFPLCISEIREKCNIYDGEVNDVASPYPVSSIKSAMKTALPGLVFMHD